MSEPNESTADERFKQIVSILIAFITVLAAIVTYLQSSAGAESAAANRDSQRYAIQAMGKKASGQTQVSYDWQGAFQTWSELNDLALSADTARDDLAGARYRKVRDRVAELSDLLSPEYFDPDSGDWPQLARYETDVYYVEATELTERYTDAAARFDAWGDKANTHIVHLTLLAVSLALFGLSTTLSSHVRRLFIIAGSAISLVTIVWVVATVLRPVDRLPDEAIKAYARGVGLAYRSETGDAIKAFDQALAAAPDYANALYERANAYYSINDYEAAVKDYEAARAAGRDDTNVGWNLGWTYYLLGRFDDAVIANTRVLELDPGLIGVRLNQGLNRLARGENAVAKDEYTQAMDIASRIVADAHAGGEEPPASLWYYLDAGSLDLQNLVDRINGNVFDWTQSPSPETIADPESVQRIAQEMILNLKSLTAALELTGKPPSDSPPPKISEFEFAREVRDDEGNFVEYEVAEGFHYRTKKVVVLFDYEGMKAGQKVLYKVYRNGSEFTSLRLLEEWPEDLGESGKAAKPLSYAYSRLFIMPAGRYEVEMYVDSHLVQRGSFTIYDRDAVVSGQSGSVLFRDNFVDPSFAGWDRYTDEDANLENTNGAYRIAVTKDNLTVWSRPRLNFADVQVEVQATRAGGPGDGEFGILCRYQDADNFYVLEATNDGYAAIYKQLAGEWVDLVKWQSSDAIRLGEDAVNQLRAECVGDRLALYVNGQLVAEVQDSDFASGDVGLQAGTFDEAGTDILFDDFVVRQPATVGSVLYQDDFSSPTGWPAYEDADYTTAYADGGYRIYVTTDQYTVWSHPGQSFDDVQIEVDTTRLGGPSNSEFGIVCRYQDGDNFYALKITNDGYYSINRREGGEWNTVVDWQTSAAIHQGEDAANHLRAECVGDRLTLYANDQFLAEAHDAAFASGDIGLLAGTFDQVGTDILFDNLVVRQPDIGAAAPVSSGGAIFQDDFSDSSSGWPEAEDADSTVGYTPDGYRIFVNRDSYTVWATPGLDISDTRITVAATKAGGPDNNEFGVMCRYQDSDNFYVLRISSDGYYSIARHQAGEWALLGTGEWQPGEAIETGDATNAIRAECVGDTLSLYANGQLLMEVEDTAFASGDVGLLAGTFDVAGADILFNNFVVSAP